MDGKLMAYELRQLLNEEAGSNQLDDFTTFNLLNKGMARLNCRIRHVTKDQSITTVADQTDYTLNADFINLYRKDAYGYRIIKYSDGSFKKGELVGYNPAGEYEFIINNNRLYRVNNKFIEIKYEYQGKEKEYNPSWLQSS